MGISGTHGDRWGTVEVIGAQGKSVGFSGSYLDPVGLSRGHWAQRGSLVQLGLVGVIGGLWCSDVFNVFICKKSTHCSFKKRGHQL